MLQPILVRPGDGGRYEIVAGQRRCKAAVLAGVENIPCIIKQMSDEETYLAQLAENIQRHDLSDYKKARALKHLIDKFGWTQEELAKKIGKTQSWVSRHLAMLSEELRNIMPRGILEKLTERQARIILSAPKDKREEIVKRVEHGGKVPSAREIEREVKEPELRQVSPQPPSEEWAAHIEEVAERPAEMYEITPQVAVREKEELHRKLKRFYPPDLLEKTLNYFARNIAGASETEVLGFLMAVINFAWKKLRELGLADQAFEEATVPASRNNNKLRKL